MITAERLAGILGLLAAVAGALLLYQLAQMLAPFTDAWL